MESECLTSEGLIHPGLKPAQTSDLTLISQVSVDPWFHETLWRNTINCQWSKLVEKRDLHREQKSKTQGTFDIMKCNFDKILLKWDIQM